MDEKRSVTHLRWLCIVSVLVWRMERLGWIVVSSVYTTLNDVPGSWSRNSRLWTRGPERFHLSTPPLLGTSTRDSRLRVLPLVLGP